MKTPYDNDVVKVRTTTRIHGGFGTVEIQNMTVKDARELRQQLAGNDYSNTKPGDKVFLGVSGTISQQEASGMPYGIPEEERRIIALSEVATLAIKRTDRRFKKNKP